MGHDMSGNGSPRITYKDIIAFREKIYEELTDLRKDNAGEFTVIRNEISEIRVDIRGQEVRFDSLIRRDTIGYVWDSLTTLVAAVAIAIGVRHQ